MVWRIYGYIRLPNNSTKSSCIFILNVQWQQTRHVNTHIKQHSSIVDDKKKQEFAEYKIIYNANIDKTTAPRYIHVLLHLPHSQSTYDSFSTRITELLQA